MRRSPLKAKPVPKHKCASCHYAGRTLCVHARGKRMKRTPMKRGTRPRRKTRLRPYNPKRRAERNADPTVRGPHHDYIKTLPCMLAGDPRHTCEGPIDGHHITTVANGGKDRNNEVPLCRAAHTGAGKSAHMLGPESFDRYWKLDSRKRARRYTRMYDERGTA